MADKLIPIEVVQDGDSATVYIYDSCVAGKAPSFPCRYLLSSMVSANKIIKAMDLMDDLHCFADESDDDFFRRIDEFGGWPLDMEYVHVKRTIENKRPCWFSNKPIKDEWNTTQYSRDDYCWWKISSDKKKQIQRTYLNEFRQMISLHMRGAIE